MADSLEADAERLQVGSQLQPLRKTLSQNDFFLKDRGVFPWGREACLILVRALSSNISTTKIKENGYFLRTRRQCEMIVQGKPPVRCIV